MLLIYLTHKAIDIFLYSVAFEFGTIVRTFTIFILMTKNLKSLGKAKYI